MFLFPIGCNTETYISVLFILMANQEVAVHKRISSLVPYALLMGIGFSSAFLFFLVCLKTWDFKAAKSQDNLMWYTIRSMG